MKRVGFQFKVRQDRLAEYKEYHKHVWPEMLQGSRSRSRIRDLLSRQPTNVSASSSEDPYVPPSPLTITTASPLPVGTEGMSYGTALSAVGGIWPYRWARISGTLPPGLFLDDLGTIGGTPTAPGIYEFRVSVTDSDTHTTHVSEKDYILTIRAKEDPTSSPAS